jgi:hypothetical protein
MDKIMDKHYKTKTLPPGGSLDSKLPLTSYEDGQLRQQYYKSSVRAFDKESTQAIGLPYLDFTEDESEIE